MDIAITISNRELTPAVVNFFQHENQTVTLNFTLDSYMYGEVDLRNYKAYGVTSQNGMIDMTELVMNYDSSKDKLVLSWQVQEYSLRQEGAITYQICFKENADDGENTAVFYSYKGIMINRGSVDGDNHITANYPTILKQWLDRINELAGTLEAGIIYIPYGESIPSSERLSGRVYFQFTDSANTEGRFEDHEGNELNLSAYLPLSGGKMTGDLWIGRNIIGQKTDSDCRIFGSPSQWEGGAVVHLFGEDSSKQGAVDIYAHDGTNKKILQMLPNGSFQWDGKNIVRSVNNTQANQSGDVTVDVGVTTVNGKKGAITPADTGCLPATGGKMTGELDLTSRPLKNVNNIELVPKSNENHGGFIDFHFNGSTEDYTSRIIESVEGRIEVTAPNGIRCNSKYLVRSINGVVADNAGEVVSSSLKNGNETFSINSDGNLTSSGYRITRDVDDEAIYLVGGTSTNTSSYLQVLGGNNSNGGQFNLVAKESDGTACTLNGTADGSLSWGSKDISNPIKDASISGKTITLTFADNSTKTLTTQDTTGLTATQSKAQNGYVKFSNGLIIQWGQIAGNSNTRHTITLPTAFTSTNYTVCSANTTYADSAPWGATIEQTTTTTFKIFQVHKQKIWWIAIGY